MMANIKANKAHLRKTVAESLKLIEPESIRNQSEKISEKLTNHSKFKNGSRISIYLSTSTEVSTDSIVRKIFEMGKHCFVPRFDSSKSQMEMVLLKSLKDFETLPVAKWNIKQPRLDEEREEVFKLNIPLDLVILPGVAFSADGKRLGHGKGYYDSFLHEHKTVFGSFPYTIALALKEQMFEDIPITDRDVILDEILTAD